MPKFITLICIVFIFATISAQESNDSIKKIKFAAIPIVNYSTTLGFSMGAMGQMYYKVSATDTVSPSSSTGIFGMYTTNHTFFTGAFQKLYLKEDKWRLMLGAGYGNVNYQYWQELPIIGGQFFGFSTKAAFAMVKVERRIYHKLYAGVTTTYSDALTEYDFPDFVPDTFRVDKRNMNNLGYLFNYDMREHQLNPYGGYNVSFKNTFYRKWMNSGNNFQKFELTYNHYYKIKNNKNIVATRVKTSLSTGDVPFQGQNVVGQDDIRGYSQGKYRNNQVYAIQAEYRWRVYKKFGVVGFLGFASAVEYAGDLFSSEILPGVGVGIRYMMIPSERINVGLDIALGKDDWGLYFRIGEAFGR